MAVESRMLPLGTRAPAFHLPNTNEAAGGPTVSLDDHADAPALLVMFICNHCPYVIHIRDELVQFAREYGDRGLAVVAINANDPVTYPADSPDRMREAAREHVFPFPYLFDESQDVARAYHAACTPDFFLFDGERRLVYRGQFDDSRPGNDLPVDGTDLRAATGAVLAGQPVPGEQKPSIGCNIKWK